MQSKEKMNMNTDSGNSTDVSTDVNQMVIDAAAVSHSEKPGFPITCSFLQRLNKIDSEPVDHIDVLMSDDENRCQSENGHHSGQPSYGSSELNVAIDKEEFEQIIPDTSMAGTSDLGSPSALILNIDNVIVNVTDPETTNLVTNTPTNAIVVQIHECLDAMDDLHILQLFTSVTQKPEVPPSTLRSETPFKSECERDYLDLHSKADDFNGASCSYVSLDDDDDFVYTQVSSLWSDFSSQRSRDGDYDSCSQHISVPWMEMDIDSKSKNKASFIMNKFLSQVVKTRNADAQEAEHALSVTASKQENVEVDKPSSGHIVPRVKNWLTSLSDHTGHFKTLPDQCVDKVSSIYNEELHSIEEQESQQTDTAVSEAEKTPDIASYSQKKKKTLKMSKLKNPFKKQRKGQKENSDSLDSKQHCSTDEKPKKRSIFFRIFSSLRSSIRK